MMEVNSESRCRIKLKSRWWWRWWSLELQHRIISAGSAGLPEVAISIRFSCYKRLVVAVEVITLTLSCMQEEVVEDWVEQLVLKKFKHTHCFLTTWTANLGGGGGGGISNWWLRRKEPAGGSGTVILILPVMTFLVQNLKLQILEVVLDQQMKCCNIYSFWKLDKIMGKCYISFYKDI